MRITARTNKTISANNALVVIMGYRSLASRSRAACRLCFILQVPGSPYSLKLGDEVIGHGVIYAGSTTTFSAQARRCL